MQTVSLALDVGMLQYKGRRYSVEGQSCFDSNSDTFDNVRENIHSIIFFKGLFDRWTQRPLSLSFSTSLLIDSASRFKLHFSAVTSQYLQTI